MTTTRNTRIFSDLDLNFINHPVTNDISKKYDEYAIKQSVKNLIMTQNYERPFHPEIGSQVMGLLFENDSPLLQATLQRTIIYTIENFEPRVNLISVNVDMDPDNNTVNISIVFKIINTERPLAIEFTLYRAR
jgi:phage baseplate assembly protein W